MQGEVRVDPMVGARASVFGLDLFEDGPEPAFLVLLEDGSDSGLL